MNDQAKIERVLSLLLKLSSGNYYTLRKLAEDYELSERTINRYISTFRSIGLVVDCRQGYYSIPKVEKPFKAINELLHFSEEEAYILTKAIHSIDDNNTLKINLVNKLYALYDFDRVAETVVKPQHTETVHVLMTAIREQKQVLLKQYRSSNSQHISDRLVEPYDFTTNYSCVWAYEPASDTCKLFKITRIEKTILQSHTHAYTPKHKKIAIDAFRISGENQTQITLRLSLRAYNLLIEEYPLAEKYIQPSGTDQWQFNGPTCGFEGIGRFVLGLFCEIDVIEPESFKNFLSDELKKMTHKN
jgi:predicted DNA-binding transcriptional regulator YafY